MGIAHRRTAGQAAAFTEWIGRAAVIAGDARQALGELFGSAQVDNGPVDHVPDPVGELDVFDILGQVVEPAEQAERVAQGREGRLPEACGHAQPGLLADLQHHAVLHGLNVDRHGGVPAGAGAHAGGDLDGHFILCAQDLGVQVAAVEFRHQGVGDIVRLDVPVEDSSVHVIDYNPLQATTIQSSHSMSYECLRNETDLV